MTSFDNLNPLMRELMGNLNGWENANNCHGNQGKNGSKNSSAGNGLNITPSKALVIAGLIGGVLEVDSVLVDKDQTLEITLQGSLKQKTQLDKMLEQIGGMPFDEVMKALLDRLS